MFRKRLITKLFLGLVILLPYSALAAQGTDAQICPLSPGQAKARLLSQSARGRTGQPVVIQVEAEPAAPPQGYYYSVIADVLEGPKGAEPDFLGGVPQSEVIFYKAGDYLLNLRVSMIAKSSCGGAKAVILLDRKIKIEIR